MSAAEVQGLLEPGYRWSEAHGAGGAAIWSGGKVPEHPLAREIKKVPYALHLGYQWIARARLTGAQRAMMLALMSRVCSKTWRWPPKDPPKGFKTALKGSSMEELAHAVGFKHARSARRVIAELEKMDLVRRVDLRPARNHYQIVAERLRALGEQGKVIEADFRRNLAEQRDQALADADAALDENADAEGGKAPGAADTGGPPSSGRSEKHAPLPLPAWLLAKARRDGIDPKLLGRLCRAAHTIGGDPGPWTNNGQLGRPVVREWTKIGKPSASAWERFLEGLAKVEADGGFPKARRAAKAQRGALRLLQLIRHAENRQAGLEALVSSAESAAAGSHGGEERPPVPGGALELGQGLGGLPPSHPPADREGWTEKMHLFRQQLGALYEMWLQPLVVEGVDQDGMVIVRAPDGASACWIAEHYAVQVMMAAGGPVRLVWGDPSL